MTSEDGIIERDVPEVNGSIVTKTIIKARRLRTGIFLIGLTTALVATLACSREAKAERLYEEALEKVESGELRQAVELFEETVRLYPDTEAAKRAREDVTLYRGLADAELMYPLRRAREEVVRTARALQRFRDRRRRWPEHLEQLMPDYVSQLPMDPWGRVLLYKRKGKRGYALATLGSDGALGGRGEAADLFVEDGSFVRSPSVSWP